MKLMHSFKSESESHPSPALSYKLFQGSLRTFDNSKPEDKQFKQHIQTHEKQLQMRKEKVKKNQDRHYKLKERFTKIEELLKETTNKLRKQENLQETMNNSSVIIQKVFRGYILRKKLELKMIHAKQEKVNQNLGNMAQDKEFLMYNVGKMPEISAIVIQKAYKRYKARCFFNRLLQTYKAIQLQKEEENFRNLREKLTILIATHKKKTRIFEKFRKEKLVLIKEKLALLKIKGRFKKLGLSASVILEKIKKYKRRLRATIKRKTLKLQTLMNENQTPNEEELKKIDNLEIGSEEDFETTTSDREAEERAQMMKKMEDERKTKIKFGKIAYNLRDLKLPKILTTRFHQEVPMSETKHQTFTLKKQKKKVFLEKNESFVRKQDGEEPSYMRTTISYNLSKLASKNNSFDEEKVHFSGQVRDKSTLFEPTKASLLKISRRRSLSVDVDQIDELRQSMNQFISVKIKEKPKSPYKSFNQTTTVQVKKKEISTKEITILPLISTKHQVMPVKVKPRAELMKGFTKVTRVNDLLFDFN